MKTLLVSSEYSRNSSFTNSKKHFTNCKNFLDFDTKIRGKKLLPTKSLVNSNVDITQTGINPRLLLKVRKANE